MLYWLAKFVDLLRDPLLQWIINDVTFHPQCWPRAPPAKSGPVGYSNRAWDLTLWTPSSYWKKIKMMMMMMMIVTGTVCQPTSTVFHVWDCYTVLLQDVIGKALPRIGAYGDLDNTRQVVALINDVSTQWSLITPSMDSIARDSAGRHCLCSVSQVFPCLAMVPPHSWRSETRDDSTCAPVPPSSFVLHSPT